MNGSTGFNPKNILCPLDFSDLSGLALKYAAAGAGLYGARLLLLHAGSFDLPRYFLKNEADHLRQEIIKTKEMIQKDLGDYLINIMGEAAKRLDVAFEVTESDPADAILKTAERESVDLIVVGTHGLTGVKRLLLGSTAESVIHNSKVPVFTVRQKENDFIDVKNPNISPRIEHILCACRIDRDDMAILDHAVSIAERFKAGLTVLYSDESQGHEDISKTRERLCNWISGAVKTQCRLGPVIRQGRAADQIIAHAAEEKSDLIVIGARHRLSHDAMILGHTTNHVVRHAPTPVLVIPA